MLQYARTNARHSKAHDESTQIVQTLLHGIIKLAHEEMADLYVLEV